MSRHSSPIAPAALIAAAIVVHAPTSAAAPSDARRLTDLFPEPVPGALVVAAPPARVGDTLFFPGWDPKNQWAMWSSDGSADRATLLRGSRAQTPAAFDGQAYFVGSDATTSRLFVSDGTPAGTRAVAELGGAQAGSLTAAAGALYMRGGDAHPWRSDGTGAGTLRLTERASLSDAPGFLAWNGAVWFLALGDDGHLGLWATGGTPQSTGEVADLGDASAAARFAYGLAASAGRLYFYTSQEPRGASYRLWSSDGTAPGTAGLHDFAGTFASLCPGPCFGIGPETLAVLGAEVVFVADDAVHGRELWETDGTAAGTRLLADIAPGAASGVVTSFQDPRSFGSSAAYTLFAADDGVHGAELWRTDGTPAGTYLLADLAPGADGSYPYGFVAAGDQLFFTALQPRTTRGAPASAIWRTDGTAGGTVIFRDGGATLYQLDGGFAAADASGLWTSDGVSFRPVDDLARPRGLDPLGVSVFGEGVVFSRIDDDDAVHDLWRWDPRAAAAGVVAHFAGLGALPAVADGRVYLDADDGVHGMEPWISDGIAAGTRLLKDIASGAGAVGSNPNGFTGAGGRVYFTAWDGAHGVELWITDGTEAGTRIVEDFTPGPDGSVPGSLTAFRGTLAFTVAFPAPGGVWRTDGTSGGTRQLAAVSASDLVAAGRALFFLGFGAADGWELWTSDGTAAGTRRLHAFGSDFSSVFALTAAGDRVFFVAQAADHQELWFSDGTENGTRSLGSFPVVNELTAAGDSVFFAAVDAEHGFELWASDGTRGGTRLVRDVAPGAASSSPASLAAAGGRVFFSADDGEHGIEPWVSDGTAEGTRLLEDLSPGPASSSPGEFRIAGDTVYFRASDDATGAQLWSVPVVADGDAPPGQRARPTRTLPTRPQGATH